MAKKFILYFVLIAAIAAVAAGIGWFFWPTFFPAPERANINVNENTNAAANLNANLNINLNVNEVVPPPPAPIPGWLTFRDPAGAFEFQYPEVLGATYISTAEWPPAAEVTDDEFVCGRINLGNGPPEQNIPKTINGHAYCVTESSEGAAGSTYTTYTYLTVRGEKSVSLKFTLRYPQCLNYDDPKQSECLAERESFDLDALVDRMMDTVVFE